MTTPVDVEAEARALLEPTMHGGWPIPASVEEYRNELLDKLAVYASASSRDGVQAAIVKRQCEDYLTEMFGVLLRHRNQIRDRLASERRARSVMEDAAFHFLTCATCRQAGPLCVDGQLFEAAMRGDDSTDQPQKALRPCRFDCDECGQGIAVDEDGTCRSCGADARVVDERPSTDQPQEKV